MLKAINRRNGGHILSSCRRIEAVASLSGRPRAALVLPGAPCLGITEGQLAALEKASAGATFAVFGSTEGNYPDKAGPRRLQNGRKFAHYPGLGRDKEGGAASLPTLLAQIVEAGHSLTGLGYSVRPLARGFSLPTRVPHADSAAAYHDYMALKRLVSETTGRSISFLTPVGERESTRDERSVFDVFGAAGGQLLTAAHNFSHLAEKNALEAFYTLILKKPANLNGRMVLLPPAFSETALGKVLGWISERGFEAVSADTLISDSPFADASGESFADASKILSAGYAVTTRENQLLPEQPLTRAELYGMLLPPHIRQDYLSSRLLGTEAAFSCNKRSEKEYYIAPGRVSSAGMLYAFEAGWPLANKHAPLTPADFSGFLDKAAAGKAVVWSAPDRKLLRRRDVFSALAQLLTL